MKVIVIEVFGIKDVTFSKSLLCNGKNNCRRLTPNQFFNDTWRQIDDVFNNFKPLHGISKALKKYIKALRSHDPIELHKTREATLRNATNVSTGDQVIQKVLPAILRKCLNYYLGEWSDDILATLKPEL